MSKENQQQETCACTESFLDLIRAPPPKREWLMKTTCLCCKKEYWTNRETDYCFDCESHGSTEAGVA